MADLRRPATMLFCFAELKSTLLQSGDRIFSEIVLCEADLGTNFIATFMVKKTQIYRS